MRHEPRIIYFIKPKGMLGPIKIGCSQEPITRLKSLMSWSPFELEIVATAQGSMVLETKVHRCFADLHSHGEWFRPEQRLLDAIEKIKNGAALGEAIDLTKPVGKIRKPKPPLTPDQRQRMKYTHALRAAENRASKQVSCRMVGPEDIYEIMSKWSGYRYWDSKALKSVRVEPQRPTEAEFARMDAAIADPIRHFLPLQIRWPDKNEQRASEYIAAWKSLEAA